MKQKLKSGYMIQRIAEENILIAGQADNINYSRMLVLNDSAAELVQILIDGEATEDDLVEYLTGNYTVDHELAQKDVKALLDELEQQQILEQVD